MNPSSPISPTSDGTDRGALRSTDPSSVDSFETDGWTCEKKRIGSPPLLPLPLRNHVFAATSEALQIFNSIRDEITSILQRYRVDQSSVRFVRRQPPGEAYGSATVLVYASSNENYTVNWEMAAKEVRVLLDARGLRASRFREPFHIEFMDRSLEEPWWAAPIETSHQLVTNWTGIRSDIVGPAISRMPLTVREGIQSINALRYGPKGNWQQLNRPTIIVAIAPSHPWSEWWETEEQIKSQLQQRSIDATCLFLRSRVEPYAQGRPISGQVGTQEAEYFSLQVDVHCTGDASLGMGDSIGPAKDELTAQNTDRKGYFGTLGGFIRLKDGKGQILGTFALTNYNVIRATINGYVISQPHGAEEPREIAPHPNTDLYRIDRTGIARGPDRKTSPGNKLTLEAPGRRLARYTRTNLDIKRAALQGDGGPVGAGFELVRTQQLARLDRQQQKLEIFYGQDKQRLGSVVAASGFDRRSPTNGRLDWAILRVDPRRNVLSNKPDPTRGKWSPNMVDLLEPVVTQKLSLRNIVMEPDKMKDRTTDFFKLGACTGGTMGQFSTVKSDVKFSDAWNLDRGPSKEYAFLGSENLHLPERCHHFSHQGDSGAWVFNSLGNWFGVVLGGQKIDHEKETSQSLAYVTPARDIVEDIVKFMKADGFEVQVELPE